MQGMTMKAATGFKLVVLAMVAVGAGWLVWKASPPYELGSHEDSVAEARTGSSAPPPKIGNCQIFPADNVWNTAIDKLPKDRRSESYIGNIGPGVTLHPDFGSSLQSGIPFTEIGPYQRRVGITFDYRDESDLSNYPIPPDAPIEGGLSSTGDRHILIIDRRRCLLYEIFDAYPNSDGTWRAGSGAKFDLTGNALRKEGMTSADAAGLPILPGLVRYDEVAAGQIDHALRFTIKNTQAAYIWPARHKASRENDAEVPPMGIRFRLRADYDISGYSKPNQVILTALKKYGMILADNGSSVFITGVPDKRWDDEDLHKLTKVVASDFEAVDESELQLLPDSARVDPMVLNP
jgi:hypothetical protein